MTQEEKQLLLKDLCARLPYGVVVNKKPINESFTWQELQDFQYGKIYKPYLRPMSSMTEEEIDRMWEIYESGPAAESSVAVAEYLYGNHLDCHYLIEKGLALEASEGMYKIE